MPSEEHKRRKTQARRHKRRKAQAEREKITRDPVNKTYSTTPQRGTRATAQDLSGLHAPTRPALAPEEPRGRTPNADRFGGERPHKSARRSARQAGRQGRPRRAPLTPDARRTGRVARVPFYNLSPREPCMPSGYPHKERAETDTTHAERTTPGAPHEERPLRS